MSRVLKLPSTIRREYGVSTSRDRYGGGGSSKPKIVKISQAELDRLKAGRTMEEVKAKKKGAKSKVIMRSGPQTSVIRDYKALLAQGFVTPLTPVSKFKPVKPISDIYAQSSTVAPPMQVITDDKGITTLKPHATTFLEAHVYSRVQKIKSKPEPKLSSISLKLIDTSKQVTEKSEKIGSKVTAFMSPHIVKDVQSFEQEQLAKFTGGLVKAGGSLASMVISSPAGAEIAVREPEYITPGIVLTAHGLTTGAVESALKHPHDTAAMLVLTAGTSKFGGKALTKSAILDIERVSVVETVGTSKVSGLYLDAFGKSTIIGGVKGSKPFIGSPELTLKHSWRPTTPHEAATVKQSFKSRLTDPEAVKFESILEISQIIGKDKPIHIDPIKIGEQSHVPAKAAVVESIIKSDPGHVFYGSAAQRAQSLVKSKRLSADIDLQATDPIRMGQSIVKKLKEYDPHGGYKSSHGGRLIETAAGEHMFDIHHIHPTGSFYAQKWGLRVQKPIMHKGQRLEPIGAQVAKKGLATTERIVKGKLQPPEHRRLKDIQGFEEGLSEIITIKKSAVESSYLNLGEYVKLKKLKDLTKKAGLKTEVGDIPLPKLLRLFETSRRSKFIKSETAQAKMPRRIKFGRKYPEYKQYPGYKVSKKGYGGYPMPLSLPYAGSYVAPIQQQHGGYYPKPFIPDKYDSVSTPPVDDGYHDYKPPVKDDDYIYPPPVKPPEYLPPEIPEDNPPIPPIEGFGHSPPPEPIILPKSKTKTHKRRHRKAKRGFGKIDVEHFIGGAAQFVQPIRLK